MAAQFRTQISGLYGGIRSYAHRLPQSFGRTTLTDANRPIAMAANNPRLTSESGMALIKPLAVLTASGVIGAAVRYGLHSNMSEELSDIILNTSPTIAGIAAGVVTLGAVSLAASIRQNMEPSTEIAKLKAINKGQLERIIERDETIRTQKDEAYEKDEKISQLERKPAELAETIQQINAQLTAVGLAAPSALGGVSPELMAGILLPVLATPKERLLVAGWLSKKVMPGFVGNESPRERGGALAKIIYANPDLSEPSELLSWLYGNNAAEWGFTRDIPVEWKGERVRAFLARAEKLKPGDAKVMIDIHNMIISAREEKIDMSITDGLIDFCKKNKSKFRCDESKGVLIVLGKMTEKERDSLLKLYPNSGEDQAAVRKLFEQSRDLVLPRKLAKISDKCERSLWRLISLSPMKAFPEIAEILDVEPKDIIEVETERVLGGKMAKYEARLTGRQVLELEKMKIPGLNIEDCGTYCITIEAADKHAAVKALVDLGIPEKRIRAYKTEETDGKTTLLAGLGKEEAEELMSRAAEQKDAAIKKLIDLGIPEKMIKESETEGTDGIIALLAGLGKEAAEELVSLATSQINKTELFGRLITVPASKIDDAKAALAGLRVPNEAVRVSEIKIKDDKAMIWAELSAGQEKALKEQIHRSTEDPGSAKLNIAWMRIEKE